MLKRLALLIFVAILLGNEATAFASPPNGAYCLNPSNQWIPVAALVSSTVYPGTPPPASLYGSSNGGTTWYPLACDANGHLVVAVSNLTGTIAGVAAATGTPNLTGGTVPAGANFILIYAVNSAGLPIAQFAESAEVDTTGLAASISWSWASVSGATSYQILCATSTGAETGSGFTSSTNSYTQTVACPVSPTNLGLFTLFTSAAGSGHIYNVCETLLTSVANLSAEADDGLYLVYTFGGVVATYTSYNAMEAVTAPQEVPGFTPQPNQSSVCGDFTPDSSTPVAMEPSLGDFASTVQWTVTWYQKN